MDNRPVAVWVRNHTRLIGLLLLLGSGAAEYWIYEHAISEAQAGKPSIQISEKLIFVLFFLGTVGVGYLIGGKRTWDAMERCPRPLRFLIIGAILAPAFFAYYWFRHQLEGLGYR
jgi:hypothetical protein